MTEQPEALRLATTPGAIIPVDIETTVMLAAELRHLHEEVTEQGRLLSMSAERELSLLARIDRLEKLEALNAELLKALKSLVQVVAHLDPCPATLEQARAAITKATGEQA